MTPIDILPAKTLGPRRLLAAVLALGVFGVGAAVPATTDAWAYQGSVGRPGGVSLPQIHVADLVYSWGGPTLTLMTNTGAVAYRSPATTGAQDVSAVYLVERWNGYNWVQVTSTSFKRRIAAGSSSVGFPAMYIQPTWARGYLRVSWGFGWTIAGTTTQLGQTFVLSDRTSDHVCLTPYRPCQPGAGWVRVGGLNGSW